MEYEALSAARTLAESGLAWCWLDGEAAAPDERRVSYLGVASSVLIAERGRESEFLDQLSVSAGETTCGFTSGWVTALSYEFGVSLLGIDPHPDSAAPAFALRLDAVLAIDHETGTSRVTGDPAARRVLHQALHRTPSAPNVLSVAHRKSDETPEWRSDDADYLAQIASCREAICRGDAYVLCLTDTAELSLECADPLAIYERLRAGGVARRGAVISIPGRTLVSASPERFLSVTGRSIATHPMKGTRPRGETHESDDRLAAELAADAKERAENLMIVDLMRNDLSRVCDPGTVRVEQFLSVETHPHVHQLVSTVTGQLSEGKGVAEALRVAFPGGSMTGAPKHSSVAMLQRLERGPRGLYSGCFGWIDDSGDAELAMTIRGVELRETDDGRVRALVGSGGGITADSHPEHERIEKALKARAVFAALRAEP